MSGNVGNAVRAYRLARGWTQEELARRAVTCGGTVSRLERGESVAHNSLLRIARALRVKLRELEASPTAPLDTKRTEGERAVV